MSREEYQGLDLDAKVELIRGLVPLGLMHVHELLEDELNALAGEWYARRHGLTVGIRYGSNPGTVRMAGQRVPIRVPRVRSERGIVDDFGLDAGYAAWTVQCCFLVASFTLVAVALLRLISLSRSVG